jgi:hypothetical protein
LEHLAERELIQVYDQSKVKHFIAKSPDVWLRQEQERIRRAQNIFPDLRSLYGSDKAAAKVHLFHGLPEIKKMYMNFLSLGYTSYKVIGSEEGWMKADAHWFNTFAQQRQKAGITIKILMEDSPVARRTKTKRAYGREIKFIPNQYRGRFITSDCSIFPDRIVYQNYGAEMVSAVIESKEAAALQNILFNLAWDAIDS